MMDIAADPKAFVVPAEADRMGTPLAVFGNRILVKTSSRDTGGAFCVMVGRTEPMQGPRFTCTTSTTSVGTCWRGVSCSRWMARKSTAVPATLSLRGGVRGTGFRTSARRRTRTAGTSWQHVDRAHPGIRGGARPAKIQVTRSLEDR